MIASALITRARYTLQDTNANRWSNDEMLTYINDGLTDLALATMHHKVEQELSVVSTVSSYVLSYPVIQFELIDTTQSYSITNNQTIVFDSPVDETVDVVYYAYTNDVAIGDELPIEKDLEDALKYYVLKRCYEKEDSTENFSKAAYFDNEYRKAVARNSSRWEDESAIVLAKQDYYS